MAQIPGGDWPALSAAEETAMAERYAEEIGPRFRPGIAGQAMDKEGLDLAILYPTARHVTRPPYPYGPALAARYAGPTTTGSTITSRRLIEAPVRRRCVSPHRCRGRRRRNPLAVLELGMKAIFCPQHLQRQQAVARPFYDPLWRLPGAQRAGRVSRDDGLAHEGGRHDRFQALGIAHISTHPMEQMLACMTSSWAASWERFRNAASPFSRRSVGGCRSGSTAWTGISEWREPYAR